MNTKRIKKVIISVAVIGAAVAYLLYLAAESSWSYYNSVDEFLESSFYKTSQNDGKEAPRAGDNRIIRLAGRVKGGSIVRDSEKMQLDFELAGQKGSVPVIFYGVAPKNLAANKEVVVEGKLGTNGIFKASKILTRCESKYKVKLKLQTEIPDSTHKQFRYKE